MKKDLVSKAGPKKAIQIIAFTLVVTSVVPSTMAIFPHIEDQLWRFLNLGSPLFLIMGLSILAIIALFGRLKKKNPDLATKIWTEIRVPLEAGIHGLLWGTFFAFFAASGMVIIIPLFHYGVYGTLNWDNVDWQAFWASVAIVWVVFTFSNGIKYAIQQVVIPSKPPQSANE